MRDPTRKHGRRDRCVETSLDHATRQPRFAHEPRVRLHPLEPARARRGYQASEVSPSQGIVYRAQRQGTDMYTGRRQALELAPEDPEVSANTLDGVTPTLIS